jgi:hypothetical protein
VEPPVVDDLTRGDDRALILDADGNALGGLRYPALEAPVASYSGGAWGDCQSIQPQFGADRLDELYSSDSSVYLKQFGDAASSLVEGKLLRQSDADLMESQAREFADRVLSAPVPSATPSAAPSDPSSQGAASEPGSLAATGSASTVVGVFALAVMVLGGLVIGFTTRRRRA